MRPERGKLSTQSAVVSRESMARLASSELRQCSQSWCTEVDVGAEEEVEGEAEVEVDVEEEAEATSAGEGKIQRR